MTCGREASSSIVIFQFLVNFINIINGVAAFCRSGIYHMDKHLGTLNMTQELMAESDALRSALNQSGNICHDKACFRHPDLPHPDWDSRL